MSTPDEPVSRDGGGPSKDADGFLRRWSRRKLEPETGGAPHSAQNADAASAAMPAETVARLDQVPAGPPPMLTEDDFKDVDFDTLDYGSDYTRFMDTLVPDAIRQKALAKLWLSDPVLANLDGLDMYHEDYTDAAMAVDKISSSWQVGQGFLTDEEVATWDRLGRPEQSEPAREVAEAEGSEQAEQAGAACRSEQSGLETDGMQPAKADAAEVPDESRPQIANDDGVAVASHATPSKPADRT